MNKPGISNKKIRFAIPITGGHSTGNPDVKTDSNGKETISFYYNDSCKAMNIMPGLLLKMFCKAI
ncbi:MAG: hypothetical protein WC542_07625 [Paludibacter sp.]